MTPPFEPNQPLDPTDEAAVDTRLARQHRDMGADLTGALDLGTGLREILLAGQHRDMGADIAGMLNLDAGLAAIFPHHRRNLPPAQFGSFTDLLDWLSSAPMVRLTHRHQLLLLAIDTEILRVASTRFRDPAREHNLDRVRELARARNLDRDLVRVLDLTLDLDLTLAHDLDVERDLDRVRTRVRVRTRALAHALALALDCARDRDRIHALASVRDRVRVLALDLARVRKRVRRRELDLIHDQTCDLVRMLCEMLVHLRVGDLVCAINSRTWVDTSWLDPAAIGTRETDRLNELAADFVGVDLREARLNGLDLVGVRWSKATRWPPADVDWIVAASEPVEKGVYVIRGSSTSGGIAVVPDPVSV
jgi:hypothetical protein